MNFAEGPDCLPLPPSTAPMHCVMLQYSDVAHEASQLHRAGRATQQGMQQAHLCLGH